MKKIITLIAFIALVIGIIFVINIVEHSVEVDRCLASQGTFDYTQKKCIGGTSMTATSTTTTSNGASSTTISSASTKIITTSPTGQTVVSTLSNERLVVTTPTANELITSPVSLSGRAAGWYFEGSFPITITDAAGKAIGQGYVTAQSDWMTASFVDFKGSVSFTAPTAASSPSSATGYVIFHKDNPSGLPENDASVAVPVRFR